MSNRIKNSLDHETLAFNLKKLSPKTRINIPRYGFDESFSGKKSDVLAMINVNFSIGLCCRESDVA